MNLEHSFIDTPPCGLLPFNTKTIMLIQRAGRKAGANIDDSVEFLGTYLCVSSGVLAPNMEQIEQAFDSLDEPDLQLCFGYVNGVLSRKEAASFEVESQLGKPQAEATTP